MKIKQTIMALALFICLCGFIISPIASADAGEKCGSKILKEGQSCCGGVVTSILDCDQEGLCTGGEDPYEGTSPKDAVMAEAYLTKYAHTYGMCKGGVAPNTDPSTNGIWGILLIVINILTAGIAIAAIGGIVYGSILYGTAGGGGKDGIAGVKKAKEIIVNVVIGLVAYAFMYALLNYLIPGGILN